MISFGGSFKSLTDSWDIWLRKFQRLLRSMACGRTELRVIHSDGTGDYLYVWTRRPLEDEWTFHGGPRELGEELARIRAWIPEGEAELVRQPDNADLMSNLISAYDRVGFGQKARDLLEWLTRVAPDVVRDIEWI